MAQVIAFHGWTKLPIPVERVLDGAKACESVLVLGWDAEGELYAAGSQGDARELLWLIEMFKQKLLQGDYA